MFRVSNPIKVLILTVSLNIQSSSAIAATQLSLGRVALASVANMNRIPIKFGYLDSEIIEEKSNACRRNRSRQKIMSQTLLSSLEITSSVIEPIIIGSNNIDNFFEDEKIESRIDKIDEFYQMGAVKIQPWSGDYWPINNGGISKRYADSKFPQHNVKPWNEVYEYFLNHKAISVSPEMRSPAEKYDEIVGDLNYSLTAANWNVGKRINERQKKVESWMGLCHGWAPAAIMEPRPRKSVDLSMMGHPDLKIKFRPDDIKALYTAKWANGVNVTKDLKKHATKFLGGRCDVKDPQVDEESGRIIDPNCFDLNPAAWHLAMTHQIGKNRSPLIIDASFDYEVWNQPVISYEITYFNPKTLETSKKISANIISLDDPNFKDKFKKFRNHPEATKLVGVVMSIKYISESSPSIREYDESKYDRIVQVEYYYDLELDQNLNILDGEWYQNMHPDFIWRPLENSIAINYEDLLVVDRNDAISVAPKLSAQGSPLRFVLDQITEILMNSNRGENYEPRH